MTEPDCRQHLAAAEGPGIGFAVAAPVAPIGMLCIPHHPGARASRRVLRRPGSRRRPIPYSAWIGVLGLTVVRDLIDHQRFWLGWAGIFRSGLRHLAMKKPVCRPMAARS